MHPLRVPPNPPTPTPIPIYPIPPHCRFGIRGGLVFYTTTRTTSIESRERVVFTVESRLEPE
jgi:hypothetical protein